MRVAKRHELASSGLDDFFANLGGHNTGIRVPSAAISEGEPHHPLDYLFLLHCVDLVPGDELVGLAQLLTIAAPQLVSSPQAPAGPAAPAAPAASPLYPGEKEIVSPVWHFPDAFARWFLTEDKKPPSGGSTFGGSDSDTFRFEDSDTPALLYETVHFPAVPLAPGYLGLDDYTAPGIRGSVVLEARDLRWPWSDLQPFPSLRKPVDTPTRFRFYLRLRQTDPGTRIKLPLPNTVFFQFPTSFTPEDGYLSASQTILTSDTLQYWRCAGRIVYQSGKHLRHFQEGESAAVAPERC